MSDENPRFPALAQFLERGIPFNEDLGILTVHMEAGMVVLRIPWQDRLIGDVFRSAVHGGVISTVIDAAGGASVFTLLTGYNDRASTVDLRVDYLRPVPAGGDIFCSAKVLRMGNKVAVTHMEVFSGEMPKEGTEAKQNPLAIGKGVYNVLRKSEA